MDEFVYIRFKFNFLSFFLKKNTFQVICGYRCVRKRELKLWFTHVSFNEKLQNENTKNISEVWVHLSLRSFFAKLNELSSISFRIWAMRLRFLTKFILKRKSFIFLPIDTFEKHHKHYWNQPNSTIHMTFIIQYAQFSWVRLLTLHRNYTTSHHSITLDFIVSRMDWFHCMNFRRKVRCCSVFYSFLNLICSLWSYWFSFRHNTFVCWYSWIHWKKIYYQKVRVPMSWTICK